MKRNLFLCLIFSMLVSCSFKRDYSFLFFKSVREGDLPEVERLFLKINPEKLTDYTLSSDSIASYFYFLKENNCAEYDLLPKVDPNSYSVSNGYKLPLIIVAVLSDNKDMVEFFLRNGIDINEKDTNGKNALMYTTILNRPSMSLFLIENGIEMALFDNEGSTPLLNEICNGKNSEVLSKLIENGVCSNLRNDKEQSILIEYILKAQKSIDLNVVNYLIASGIDPSILDADRNSAFTYACQIGNFDLVKYLFEYEKDINRKSYDSGKTPLHYAAENGNNEIIDFLLNNEANVLATDSTKKIPYDYCKVSSPKLYKQTIMATASKATYRELKITPERFLGSRVSFVARLDADSVYKVNNIEKAIKVAKDQFDYIYGYEGDSTIFVIGPNLLKQLLKENSVAYWDWWEEIPGKKYTIYTDKLVNEKVYYSNRESYIIKAKIIGIKNSNGEMFWE